MQNRKQSFALHQRPYIPHVRAHADTLGAVYICDSAAGLSLREVIIKCALSFYSTKPNIFDLKSSCS